MPASTTARLAKDDAFPQLELESISGDAVCIPTGDGELVHLQFRRFAGCPICNLHLRSLSQRLDEVERAGVREVVVFHSTEDELRKYQAAMPFSVVANPERVLYERFGVETSPRALLKPGAWRALPGGWANSARSAVRERRAPLPLTPTGGNLGLPADVLIGSDGRVAAVKYGKHAYDQWSVDEILAHAQRSRREG